MADTDLYSSTSSYPGTAGATGDNNPSGTQGLRDRVSSATSQAREKAAELGRTTADKIDRNLETAAGKLHDTADALRQKAGLGNDRVSQLASTAADKLDATATYFRSTSSRDMMSGVEQSVRRNPGASLAAALAVGFLIGAAMKRDKY